jgi:tRNA pseudouridine32 synthase/23S rRNA pseudouridine746 synthase/23S rRNA pseudouridine1911/1915/1917 synthase
MKPADIESRLLYRDGLMLILNKPAGIPVHLGPGKGEHLEMYLDALRFGLPKPPALAHRLDRDTSGCLILGRHAKALRRLGGLFANGRIGKTYWAIVHGRPPHPEGVISLPLRKRSDQKHRWWMMVAEAGEEGAQEAVTGYRLMGESEGKSWLEFTPRTGRTHQIRVHGEAIGCPLVGDPVYGPTGGIARGKEFLQPSEKGVMTSPDGPLQLHSRAIEVPLYPSKPPIRVTAPPPPHMLPWLERCGWKGEENTNPA